MPSRPSWAWSASCSALPKWPATWPARYGALGVPDASGEMEQFATSGMTAEEIKRVGHPPRGKGLLGMPLREPNSIRVSDIAADPRSAGFCENHSPFILRERREDEALLDRVVAAECMTPDLVTLPPDASVLDAARLIHDRKFGGIPIVADGRLVGVVTETDLLACFISILA